MEVSKSNPDTVVVQSFTTDFSEAWGILLDGAHIWVADNGDDTLKRLNSDGSVAQTNVGSNPQHPIFVTGWLRGSVHHRHMLW